MEIKGNCKIHIHFHVLTPYQVMFSFQFWITIPKGKFCMVKNLQLNIQMINSKCFINWFFNLHHKLLVAQFDNGNCVKLLFHEFIFLHTNVIHVLDTQHSCAKNTNSWNNKFCANFKQTDDHYTNMHPSHYVFH
jgi:hypothetical protein